MTKVEKKEFQAHFPETPRSAEATWLFYWFIDLFFVPFSLFHQLIIFILCGMCQTYAHSTLILSSVKSKGLQFMKN